MMDKVYKIIDSLNNNKEIIRLEEIKKSINSDKKLKKLINDFNKAKEHYEKYNITDEFISAKKKLLENEIIKEYIEIQNKINILALKINKRINNITTSTTCKK